ncbi:MAG: type II toxin-antitoxin system VapC family toxin [Candidatus Latescibacteria bacterium]|mgnify:CR=1 FL=1|jgi:tRNA(fMet)-specific endonuclease VapC|nr:type II toxin-antitoxin system VapC family toxin [Candidatus Latescibacterota bacterium]MBT5833076.1 type II toxin-antitoxin system VapC family toxin [Candidatus Latescibacterota bacterium]
MIYLLDTNAWISYLNYKNSPIVEKLAQIQDTQIVFCSIVKAELLFGAYKSSRQDQNLSTLHRLFQKFKSYSFNDRSAEIYGQTRSDLEADGTPIGPNDLLIASIVQANSFTLVTHNTREFQRIPNLKIEDWNKS